MSALALAMLAKGAGKLANAATGFFGDKARIDAYRQGANQQIHGERTAQGIGNEYYDKMAGEYGQEAGTYLSDLANWRNQMGQAPVQLGDFDKSQYDVQNYLDPSMQFQQDQAARQIEQAAASRGGLFSGSGATAKALQDRAMQLAQTDYGNAWNRANTEQQQGYNEFLNKFKSAQEGEAQRLENLSGLAKQSGLARENQFSAMGGRADLGMGTERSIADLLAGKARAKGEYYGNTWDRVGKMSEAIGDMGAASINPGGAGDVKSGGDLAKLFSGLPADQQQAFMSALLKGKP